MHAMITFASRKAKKVMRRDRLKRGTLNIESANIQTIPTFQTQTTPLVQLQTAASPTRASQRKKENEERKNERRLVLMYVSVDYIPSKNTCSLISNFTLILAILLIGISKFIFQENLDRRRFFSLGYLIFILILILKSFAL